MTSASGGLVYGRSKLNWFIRFLTQRGGESPTLFDHVFVLRRDGTGVESLGKGGAVELPDYREKYDCAKRWGITFAVLDEGFDHSVVEAKLDEYLGTKYDKFAIAKCALDGLLAKVTGHDVFLFRRFRLKFWKRQERWNICSWLYSCTHRHAGHRVHGVVTTLVRLGRRRAQRTTIKALDLRRITPDDIGDDVAELRPRLYRVMDEFGTRPDWLAEKHPRLAKRIDYDLGLPTL